MGEISLREYVREIEKHLDNGRFEEAIAHCHHILTAYPKYLEAYRLLGKALLEEQRYGDAADVFQRLLSAIPDDFVAHAGMSIVREDEGNLEEAIWHMERAFDVQPSNAAIQEELRRLYRLRDGVEPPRIRLSRSALARMYLRGELYPQAIAETRAALTETPQRLDLLVLLAEAYLKAGQLAEAAETAKQILRRLPYCLVANQVMFTVFTASSQKSEAATYYQRLRQLDPYYGLISESTPTPEQIPDVAIRLEKLEWKIGQAPTTKGEQPVWASSLGIDLSSVTPEEHLPDWLASAEEGERRGLEPGEVTVLPTLPPEAQQTLETEPDLQAEAFGGEEVLPSWLKDLGWQVSSKEAPEVTEADMLSPGEETPASIEAPAEIEPAEAEEAELPEWLQEIAPLSEETAPPPPAEELQTPTELQQWAEALFAATQPGAAPTGEEMREGEIGQVSPPDEVLLWEESRLAEESAPSAIPSKGEPPEQLYVPGESLISEPSLPSAGEEEIGAWLYEETTLSEHPPSPSEEIPPAVETPSLETPEELAEWLYEEVPPVKETPPQEEELPEWLFAEETTPAGEAAPLPEEEWLDWLKPEAQSELPPTEPSIEELPDWLREGEEGLAIPLEEPEEAPSSVTAPPDFEIPSWLEEWRAKLKEEGTQAPPTGSKEAQPLPTEEEVPFPATFQPPEASLESLPSRETSAEMPLESVATEKEVEEAFAWLEKMLLPVEEITSPSPPSPLPPAESAPPPGPPGPAPSEGVLDDEAAFAWLEGLAARQGAQEALLLRPEERRQSPPEWVLEAQRQAEEIALPTPTFGEVEEQPPLEEPVSEQPDEVLAASQAPEPISEPLKPPPITPPEGHVPPFIEEELPSWLIESTHEAPEEPLEWTPPPVVTPKLDLNQASLGELERLPGIGYHLAQRILEYRLEHGRFSTLEDLLNIPEVSPGLLAALRDFLFVTPSRESTLGPPLAPESTPPTLVMPQAAGIPDDILQVRRWLQQGDFQAALAAYAELIQRGEHLEWVIDDLDQAASQYPNRVEILQTLGDAYLRADRVTDALRAYLEAEKRLA